MNIFVNAVENNNSDIVLTGLTDLRNTYRLIDEIKQ